MMVDVYFTSVFTNLNEAESKSLLCLQKGKVKKSNSKRLNSERGSNTYSIVKLHVLYIVSTGEKKMELTYRTKGWKHAFSIIKMQIFPKTKGFCNKKGLFRKNPLFSIQTSFAFLEKTPNIGF